MTPTTGDDLIDGTIGNDTINALAGDDTVNGLDGDDILSGDDGNDQLQGGAGSDFLQGDRGADTLTGGSGFDRFFNAAEVDRPFTVDFISDLEPGETISIGSTLRVPLGSIPFATFIGQNSFSGNVGEVRYSFGGGQTKIETDVNGDGVSDYSTIIVNGEFFLRLLDEGDRLLEIDAAYGGSESAAADRIGGSGLDETLSGGDGNDTLHGAGGDDFLLGDGGDDSLFGGEGDDTLAGGEGNDTFTDTTGVGQIEGGNGLDSYFARFSGPVSLTISQTIEENISGFSAILFSIESVGIFLFDNANFNDVLDGSFFSGDGGVFLAGGGGNDTILGSFDQDVLRGDSGSDRLIGGIGIDIFDFNSTSDLDAVGDVIVDLEPRETVDLNSFELNLTTGAAGGLLIEFIGAASFKGASGEVRFERGAENTRIEIDYDGDAVADGIINLSNGAFAIFESSPNRLRIVEGSLTVGDDDIIGSNSSNALTGGDGDDTIQGLSGFDSLDGAAGADSLRGGAGEDLLTGGDGADTIDGGADNDTLNGGDGIDTTTYLSADGPVGVNLSNGTTFSGGALNVSGFYVGGAVEDSLVAIENVIGSAFGDRLVGVSAGSNLDGGAGADRISGLSGQDSLIGGDGDDTLEGGGGLDSLRGSAGLDRIDGGSNIDTADYSDRTDGGVSVNFLAGTTTTGGALNASGVYVGGAVEDTLFNLENVIGTDFADLIAATTSSSRIEGRGGNDAISTGSGFDTVFGGNGNDRISAGQSSDQLFGDAGNDTLDGGTGRDTLNGGSGRDAADYGDRTGGVSVNLTNAVTITGGVLNAGGFYAGGFIEDTLVLVENALGSEFADRLVAANAGSRLEGRGGNDNISGLGGRDTLVGGAGADTLAGGAENDTLTGSSGNDVFLFAVSGGADRITDFVEGTGVGDVIQLVGLGTAFDSFAEVIASASQSGADVVFNFGGGNTITVLAATVAGFAADDFSFG